jgi:hypothetical protein
MNNNKERIICDCFIGFLSGEQINLSNLKERIIEILNVEPILYQYGVTNKKPLTTIKEIVDNRRGYLLRFKYCPYCGQKLEWKKIINNL